MSDKLVFFGTEDFSATILQRLIEADYPIAAVVTKPDAKQGRGKKTVPPAVKVIGEQYHLPILQPHSFEEVIDVIAKFKSKNAVLVAYGKIIPQTILDLFPGGIINVHPSLLPKYRGPSPIEAAILNGDKTTGVSLMKLVKAMDAGPVFVQKSYTLKNDVNRLDLYQNLAKLGAEMLVENLPEIIDNRLKPKPQNEDEATYCTLIKKTDGDIDWHKSAAQIEREIRAYLGWPGSRTQIFGQDVTILEAELHNAPLEPGEPNINEGKLYVGTSEQSLEIKKLRPAGRSSMTSAEFLRGLRPAAF